MAVAWDRERYRQDVLEPARRGGSVPPPDLYTRYGVRGDLLGDPAAFARRVGEVTDYWRELTGNLSYQQLARALLAAHSALERDGPLTPVKLAAHTVAARQEQTRRLARMAGAEAGSATHAGPDTVLRLRDALGGSVTESDVAGALSQAGVQVVSAFPELPAEPHAKQPDLARLTRQLGKRLSIEVVFGDAVRHGFRVLGGFRLADGRTLDEAALRAARDRTAALPFTDPAKAPVENVLAILGTAARQPGGLDALLLSEVTERLRPLADRGFLQRPIALQARDLGLDENEAGLLAGALLTTNTLKEEDALRAQATEALHAGRLRAAQRLAAELPAADPVAERIAAQDARVAALSREADEDLASGRRDRATARLSAAVEIAADDTALTERLIALPPPAPRNVKATMTGKHVLVTWETSEALTGRLRYLVTRGHDGPPPTPSAGTVVSARGAQTRAVDEAPPPGTDLHYSVFAYYGVLADRMAEACSPPGVIGPEVLALDVTDVRVAESATAVTGSWQPPRGARAVLVSRCAGLPPSGPGDGTHVAASLTGFTDTGLRTGTEYSYRITALYQTADGRSHLSAGVVVPATPEHEPDPVTDLTVDVAGNGTRAVVATWTPPPHGDVRLMAADAPPRWAAGDRITPREADTPGLRGLPGIPRRGGDGRDRLELTLPSGRHYFVPLTMGRNTVVVGETAEADLVDPVRELACTRMHDEALVAWEWPRGATEAVVSWAGGEQRCAKHVYDDEGGAKITIGPAETSIEVRALYEHRSGWLTAPPVTKVVPARGVAVRYRVHRSGMHSRWRRTVEFPVERAVRLPTILIVQSTTDYVPGGPADGETLLRVDPRPVTQDQPVRVPVSPRKEPGWLACFTDPADPDGATILLFHPPVHEMRLP